MKYLSIPLLLIIVCMTISQCTQHKDWEYERGMYILNDSLLQKKVLDIRDSSNRQIVDYNVQAISTNQLLASKSHEVEQLTADLKKVKASIDNVRSSTSVLSTTKDTTHIKVDSIVYLKDTGNKDIPFYYHPDKFLTVAGITHLHIGDSTLDVKGHDLETSIENSTSVTFYNKSKFLHRSQLKAMITQDNPHTTTGKVQTYYIQPNKKWFEKWYVHTTIGAISAMILIHFMK